MGYMKTYTYNLNSVALKRNKPSLTIGGAVYNYIFGCTDFVFFFSFVFIKND